MNKDYAIWSLPGSIFFSFLASIPVQSQIPIIPDNSLPNNTIVNPQGDLIQIDGGTTRGNNLFHSFTEFSVPSNSEAFFNNADTISNILSRVTGGAISNIDGVISANCCANLFLINPNGIIFGPNSSLNIGGSFLGSTADSILFPDGVEYSATNIQGQSSLTINAPIGLDFRDNPGDIINRSILTDDAGEDFIGLRVPADETLALIGGGISIEELGILSTNGGRIELGSVAANNTVSLTEVLKGWDIGYEGVTNFQDIQLSGEAFVYSFGENTGDIQVQGRNISLIEGSEILIDNLAGQAANLELIASESLTLEQTILDGLPTFINNSVLNEATGENGNLIVETQQLTINGGEIGSSALGSGRGVNVEITASQIELATNEVSALIFAQVFEDGDGGDLTIETETLTLNQGSQINTSTFGAGNAGNLSVTASESITLNGTFLDSEDPNAPSGLVANVEEVATATGNGGDLSVNTPTLVVRDGAQIATAARNQGQAGTLTIDTESILLSGFSPEAQFRSDGISGIFVSAEPSFEDESGTIVPTTGNGGTLKITTESLMIENGAAISADTFSFSDGGNATINVNSLIIREGGEIRAGSLLGIDPLDQQRGSGGELTINASDSIEVTGTGNINGDIVNSSILTLAESTGDAGTLTINTNNLTVRNGGDINASAESTGAAGNLLINANSLDLDQGTLTAITAAGAGGNIILNIDGDITLRNESLISAEATGIANGGNVNIVDSRFIIAYPSQDDGNDILASAEGGDGGNIAITSDSLLNIEEREASSNNGINDIDASSDSGVDGNVTINNPDVNPFQGETELSSSIVEAEQIVGRACRVSRTAEQPSDLTIKGKGGIPSIPAEPFDSDDLLVDEQITTSDLQSRYPNIKPIKTSIGDIYPARGIIKTENGKIILTAYATDNLHTRTPNISANCSPVSQQ